MSHVIYHINKIYLSINDLNVHNVPRTVVVVVSSRGPRSVSTDDNLC